MTATVTVGIAKFTLVTRRAHGPTVAVALRWRGPVSGLWVLDWYGMAFFVVRSSPKAFCAAYFGELASERRPEQTFSTAEARSTYLNENPQALDCKSLQHAIWCGL